MKSNELLKIKERLTDFKSFLYYFFTQHEVFQAPPTQCQYDIAEWMQSGPDRQITLAFRGIGKSLVAGYYALWKLWHDPQLKVLVVSQSEDRAKQMSTAVLDAIINVPFLKELVPKKDSRQSRLAFDVGPARVQHAPSFAAKGVGGQVTGHRADIIILDDIETPKNSLTVHQRESLLRSVAEFDAILKPGGRIIYLGTPHTEDSLYSALAAQGYHRKIWPVYYPSPDALPGYEGCLAEKIAEKVSKDKVEELTDTRYTKEDLHRRCMGKTPAWFQLQFMLDTSISDANLHPLKLSDLIVTNIDNQVAPEKYVYAASPELEYKDDLPIVGFRGERYYRPMSKIGDMVPYTGTYMAIDPAGNARHTDETGYAVVKVLNGFIYLVDCGGFTEGFGEDTLESLAKIAGQYEVNKIFIEKNFGEGMFTALLTPHIHRHHPCEIEEIRSTIQKERRIADTLEPILKQHKLVVDPEVIRRDYHTAMSNKNVVDSDRQSYMLMYQMSRLTREKGALEHDDRLDALALVVAQCVEMMSLDADSQMNKRRLHLWRKMIRPKLQKRGGDKFSTKGWTNKTKWFKK